MTAPTVSHRPPLDIPEGFFAEVASLLDTEAAEEIADAVITVCTRRGILYPELDEEPDDELRAEQVHEVFALLDAVTAAVADGTIVPARVYEDAQMDPQMAALWVDFTAGAHDALCSVAVAEMIDTGTLPSTAPGD